MTNTNQLPTFHELRLRHDISLETIYEYAEQEISLDAIQLFDETGRANPYLADDLLFVLSQLSGSEYNRSSVQGIIFVLARPPISPTDPRQQAGPLPSPLTLLGLYYGYRLDLKWLGEALLLDGREVWDLLAGNTRNSEMVERLLDLISQYTGSTYMPDMIQFPQPAAALSE